jgi:GH24 family phage-related lysozyme (muramidase)
MTLPETLRQAEGVRYEMYLDHRGIETIGVGHNLRNGPPLTPLVVAMILQDDIRSKKIELFRRAEWLESIGQKRLDVIIELAFMCGTNGLFNFKKMMSAAYAGNWQKAADEMCDSNVFRDLKTRNRIMRMASALL